MKTLAIVLGTIALAIVLVTAGVWGSTAWAQSRWGNDMMDYGASGYGHGTMGPGMTRAPARSAGVGYDTTGYGYGTTLVPALRSGASAGMGGNWDWDNMPCGGAYTTPGASEIRSLEDVETAIHDYVERLGYTGLEVTEVMEFERNYYAIVAEEDTGIGAMEVLVDKSSGAVGPEPGPNMMWSAEYGMHRGGGMMGMMGGYASDEMTLSPEEAQDVAQRWLDANLSGRTAGEADPFYGYYTLHFLNDGEIEGMLSVHGSSGDIWYHSWHGDFVIMIEGHE